MSSLCPRGERSVDRAQRPGDRRSLCSDRPGDVTRSPGEMAPTENKPHGSVRSVRIQDNEEPEQRGPLAYSVCPTSPNWEVLWSLYQNRRRKGELCSLLGKDYKGQYHRD